MFKHVWDSHRNQSHTKSTPQYPPNQLINQSCPMNLMLFGVIPSFSITPHFPTGNSGPRNLAALRWNPSWSPSKVLDGVPEGLVRSSQLATFGHFASKANQTNGTGIVVGQWSIHIGIEELLHHILASMLSRHLSWGSQIQEPKPSWDKNTHI